MDEETKELAIRALKISEENNQILHKIRKTMLWGHIFRIFYWVILLLSVFGVYFLLQPFIEGILDVYKNTGVSFEKILDAYISPLKPQ